MPKKKHRISVRVVQPKSGKYNVSRFCPKSLSQQINPRPYRSQCQCYHAPPKAPLLFQKKPDTPHANDNTSCRTAHPPQKAAPMPQTSKSIAKSQAKAHEQTQTPQFTRFLSMPLQTDHLQDTCQ